MVYNIKLRNMKTKTQSQGYLYTFSKTSFSKGKWCKKGITEGFDRPKRIITVLIADDHPYLIHGVETDLNKDRKIKIFGHASTYDEVLEKAAAFQPAVILLDLRMPGRDKHNFKYYMKALKGLGNSKIIIFSNETGWPRIYKCFEYGASGYIEKGLLAGNLAELIHRIIEGDELLVYTSEILPEVRLFGHKKEILHYIADGKENDEIAILMKLNVKTIQSYIGDIKTMLSRAFGMYPIGSRSLLLMANKLGYGHKVN